MPTPLWLLGCTLLQCIMSSCIELTTSYAQLRFFQIETQLSTQIDDLPRFHRDQMWTLIAIAAAVSSYANSLVVFGMYPVTVQFGLRGLSENATRLQFLLKWSTSYCWTVARLSKLTWRVLPTLYVAGIPVLHRHCFYSAALGSWFHEIKVYTAVYFNRTHVGSNMWGQKI